MDIEATRNEKEKRGEREKESRKKGTDRHRGRERKRRTDGRTDKFVSLRISVVAFITMTLYSPAA